MIISASDHFGDLVLRHGFSGTESAGMAAVPPFAIGNMVSRIPLSGDKWDGMPETMLLSALAHELASAASCQVFPVR